MDKVYVEVVGSGDVPIKELTQSVIIGPVGADIELSHPDIQKNQLSLFLENGVISVISHNDQIETLLNERPIPLERKIILMDNDEIRIGNDILVNLKRDVEGNDEDTRDGLGLNLDEDDDSSTGLNLSLGDDEGSIADSLTEATEPEKEDNEEFSFQEAPIPSPPSGDLPPLPSENTLKIEIPQELQEQDEELEESKERDSEEKTQILTAEILEQEMDEEESIGLDDGSTLGMEKPAENPTEPVSAPSEEIQEKSHQSVDLDSSEVSTGGLSLNDLTGKAEVTNVAKVEKSKDKTDLNNIDQLLEKEKNKSEVKPFNAADDTAVKDLGTLTGIKQLKKKKKKVKVESGDSPPFLIRFFAFFIDVLLSYFIMREFVQPFDLGLIIDEMANLQLSGIAFLSKLVSIDISQYIDLNRYLPFASLYLLLRLIMNLILGSSLGQLLLGVSGGKSVLWNRVGGVLRELIGYVTFPLLVLDLPALFSKKTFKEYLSFTHLNASSKILSYVLLIIVFPAVIAVSFFMPFFVNLDVKAVKNTYQTKKFFTSLDPNEEIEIVDSEFFQIKKGMAPKDKILVFPEFELVKKNKKSIYLPVINIYDREKKQYYHFKKLSTFKMDKFLAPFIEKYPGLEFKFSHFFEMSKKKDNYIFTDGFEKEFKDAVTASLSLDKTNIIDHLLQYGPFFQAFFDMKKVIYDTVSSKFEEADFIKINNKTFLRFKQFRKRFGVNRMEHYLMSVNQYQGHLFQVVLPDRTLASEEFFYKGFLYGVEWTKDLEFSLRRVNRKKPFNTFQVFDLYLSKNVKPKHRERLVKYVYTSIYQVGLSVYNIQDPKLNDTFTAAVRNFLLLITKLNEANRKNDDTPIVYKGYDLLIKNLNELVDAIKNQNNAYFGIKSE